MDAPCLDTLDDISLVKLFPDMEAVKLLYARGADRDNMLLYAATNGWLTMVQYLCEQGADVNAYHGFILQCAAKHGHFDVVTYLCDKGAKVEMQEYEAIKLAQMHNQVEIAKFLRNQIQ